MPRGPSLPSSDTPAKQLQPGLIIASTTQRLQDAPGSPQRWCEARQAEGVDKQGPQAGASWQHVAMAPLTVLVSV